MTFPVQRLVFFRHGVAFLERAGTAQGPISLPLRQAHLSDVLKSLVSSVPLVSLSFETPEDGDALAARRGLHGLPTSPVRALLQRLRGAPVQLATRQGKTTRGMLLGVERSDQPHGGEREVAVLHEAGTLHLVDIADVLHVQTDDPSLATELDALLTHMRGQGRGDERALTLVAQSEGPLRVGYVIPRAGASSIA